MTQTLHHQRDSARCPVFVAAVIRSAATPSAPTSGIGRRHEPAESPAVPELAVRESGLSARQGRINQK